MLRAFARSGALLTGLALLMGATALSTRALAQETTPSLSQTQSPARPSPAPDTGVTLPAPASPAAVTEAAPTGAGTAAVTEAAPTGAGTATIQGPVQSGVVRAIKVEGEERVEADTVISYLPITVGDTVDAQRLDLALKTLLRTELFADVALTLQPDGTLLVRVAENPIINRVVFEGNSALSDDKLRDEIAVHPRGIFTKAKVQEDVQKLVELYRRSGHISAVITPKIVELPQKRVDLVFEIKEGPKTGIIRVVFLGNRAYSENALRDVVVTKQSEWYKFFASNDNYDPDRIEYDREQLRKFYSNHGYYDFRVNSSIAELQSDARNFAITYTIDEGAKYRFGRLRVTSDLKRLNTNVLQAILPIHQGQVYAGDQIEKAVDAITFAAGAAGFAFVDVHPRYSANRDTHTVDVTFDVKEGPRVYVQRVDIVGNTRTVDPVIRREMRIAEGDAYNRVLVDRSKTEIKRLNFFKTVDITQQPGDAPDKTILQVKVAEQSTGELNLGAGYSSIDKLMLNFGISEHNFRGEGQDLRLRADIGYISQQVDLSLTEPRLFGRDLRGSIDLFDYRTDYSQYTGFVSSQIGASGNLLFPLNINATFSPHYGIHQDSVSADAGNCESGAISIVICDQRGEALTSAPGYTVVLDMRNDPLHPTRGFSTEFDQDFAGLGGSVRYLRTHALFSTYYGFTPLWVLTARADVSYINGWGGDNIRINDRFFKGGDSFPGFQIAGIGPRDIEFNEALGGNLAAIGSMELSVPNYLPEQYGIRTALIAYAGTLGLLDKDVARGSAFIRDDLALRASAGISVFWTSPLGPIRLDFAQPVAKTSYDRTQVFRFTTATQFQ